MDAVYDYTILGAGAVGCVFGGLLSLSGKSVQLVNRSADTKNAIAKYGLRLETDDGLKVARPVAVQPDEIETARVVMVFTKTHQSDAALASMLPKADGDTVFVSLQNGLGNGQRLADAVGGGRVLHGVTMLPATMLAPGLIRTHGTHKTWLGAFSSQHGPIAEAVCADLRVAGFDIDYVAPPDKMIWQKACFNIAMNGICALSLASPGLIKRTQGLKELVHATAAEAIEVAAAVKIEVDGDQVHALVDFACEQHAYHKPSMLQDIERGRKTEIEAMNGYIVRLAAQHGIDVPLNRLVYALVCARQASQEFWEAAPD